ncbi:MAG: hypothetical protein QOE90_306 [Thermoplasmata archaeon]|jgi:outer membrane protein assembly factor BamB|nr:hypothetical protein [Thermoplasmata archaeon]
MRPEPPSRVATDRASVQAGRLAPILVAILLLAPVAAAIATLTRTIAPGAAPFNGLQMALADFRGDGKLEVVAQSDDGNVYVLDPATGATLARFAPGNAGCASTCYSFEGVSGPINAPVVTDLDGNGKLDVVLADTAAVVARFEIDPAASSASQLVFTKLWEHRYNQYQSFTTMDASPTVADLNGDGKLDVVVATEETGIFAVRPDGSTLWAQALPSGHATPSVGDLDGDGKPEVVMANDAGTVYALNGATGGTKWTFNAAGYVWPASIPMQPTLSDVNGDGHPDVLFAARDAHDSTTFGNDHAMWFALDSWGHLLWRAQPTWAAPLSHTRPVVVSVNGAKAVLVGDWNTIGHKPGNFEQVGPGHVALFDATGHEKWHRDLNAQVSDKDIMVADVVGDGTQQVVAAGASSGQTGLWLFDLATGATKGFLATPTPTRSTAEAASLFGDGKLAMAVGVSSGGGQVQVWTGAQGFNAMFPGWGAISPPHEKVALAGNGTTTPPPPPPPSGGNFTATFGPKGNEWWVETSASASGHTIASVSASLNGGAPVDLPKDSWGTWAKSIHAPSGTVLQFTATDTTGATAVSGCYLWTGATATTCSGGTPPPSPSPSPSPPPSGNMTATFTPRNGNEWWIQVHVAASETVKAVDARISGGAWQPLALQSYGDWTASYHAPTGSQVEFRATGADGAQVVSQAFTWPQ